jgi:hypothetical protein
MAGPGVKARTVRSFLQNLHEFCIVPERQFGQSTPMQAARPRKLNRLHRRPRHHRVIRKLCAQCSQLQEEVKQLSAAVEIYKELARRAA